MADGRGKGGGSKLAALKGKDSRKLSKSPIAEIPSGLECCLCGETNRDKLIVEELGLMTGNYGETYSFCSACWESADLGFQLLQLIGYPDGLKLIVEAEGEDE